MPNREKVIKEIEDALSDNLAKAGNVYRMSLNELKDKALKDVLALLKEQEEKMEHLNNITLEYEKEVFRLQTLLKEQEVRELTIDEWQEWKTNKKRDPICILWEHDTSPMWVLNPNDVHEPAFLMGKLKLFTGKPTFKQCKAVKWE